MKKIIAAACLFISACGGSSQGVSQPVEDKQTQSTVDVEKMRNQTVVLVNKTEDVYQMYCSGVWVSNTQVLTAHHCVLGGVLRSLDPEELRSILEEETPVPDLKNHVLNYRTHADYVRDHQSPVSQRARAVKVVAVEKPTDLALLEVVGPVPPHEVVQLHNKPVQDGSFVWAVGHSAGMHFTISHGVVSASRRDNDLTMLQVSVAASGGNSGCGVFTQEGNLLGVVSSGLRDAALVTFATHRDSIKDFIDANGGLK